MSTDIRVLSQNIEKIDKWPSNFHHCLSVLNSHYVELNSQVKMGTQKVNTYTSTPHFLASHNIHNFLLLTDLM